MNTAAARLNLRHPRHWPSWIGVALLRLLGRLPFRVLYVLGLALGRLGYYLTPGRRAVARRNLEVCFPELTPAERRRLLRRHFGQLGVAAISQGVAWDASRERLGRLVRMVHPERIHVPLEQGRGVIVLVPHFVALELAAIAFAALMHPGCFMYQRIRNPVIDAQVYRGRTRFGSLPIERRDDLRGMVRAITSGLPTFYLPDQDAGKTRGIFVPFCGIPASTVPMLGRFARLTGAAVVPAIARFLPRGRGVELIFDPPLEDFPSGDWTLDTQRMNQVIEARVRTLPEQYFWLHRRFKTRPEGEAPLYPESRRRRKRSRRSPSQPGRM